ncbi:hypothetical protein ACH5RR_038704 [Cinchona calisaya]|uniref:WAT1-related protein n=1 Tax=Cinchona calisaya TaxID=153742 RepID=A0ABD2XW24_9GENT
MLMGGPRREHFEDIAIIAGLIGMQFMYAGNSVLVSYLMLIGFTSASLIILSSLASFVILSPFSVIFERRLWPRKFSMKLCVQLVLISFGGVTLFQSLFLKGISLTSPAMATAMPNIAPGFIFFIAWAFRLEKVELGCIYSKAKIGGTLLCIVGAVIMSLMQSTLDAQTARETLSHISVPPPPPQSIFDEQKIMGCLYLMTAVFVLSSTIILQATTLADFPAPISLSAITSLIGVILTGIAQLIQDGKIDIGWPLLSVKDIMCYSVLAGSISGGCVTFNIWAMKKRGPVLVSIFSPIGTVISVILSVITLGSSITIGSLAGMSIMFTGLYCVLWAKRKEGFSKNNDISSESEYDVEKPLLS